MCGRFTQKLTWRQIHGLYRLKGSPLPLILQPRYNGAPSHARGICCRQRELAGTRPRALCVGRIIRWWRRGSALQNSAIIGDLVVKPVGHGGPIAAILRIGGVVAIGETAP